MYHLHADPPDKANPIYQIKITCICFVCVHVCVCETLKLHISLDTYARLSVVLHKRPNKQHNLRFSLTSLVYSLSLKGQRSFTPERYIQSRVAMCINIRKIWWEYLET